MSITNIENSDSLQTNQLTLDLMEHLSLLNSIKKSDDNLSEIIELQIKQLECLIDVVS
jgi:hypothetical protein